MSTLRALIDRHRRALTLELPLAGRPLPLGWRAGVLGLHLTGLIIVVSLTNRLAWLGVLPLALILPTLTILKRRPLAFPIETLAPLGAAYLVAGLRIGIALVACAKGTTSGALSVPDPWGRRLDLDLITGAAAVWVVAVQLILVADVFGKRLRPMQAAGMGLVGATLVWSFFTYFSIRTHGATASDPFAYVQMAVDLAEEGTLLHRFPLTRLASEYDLPTYPLAHVGYRAPDRDSGEAATVWPPGYSALMAGVYKVVGEPGLYLFAPLMGLITLGTTTLLCFEVLHKWPSEQRWLAAGIAVLLLASSVEQAQRLAVPMADIPAQVFTSLTLILALRAVRVERPQMWAALSGVCLGLAFAIRYTQVLLGVAIFALFLMGYLETRSWRKTLTLALWFSGGAWLAALPVLVYHNQAFGSPFRVGSQELELFALGHAPETFERMVKDFFGRREFLYLSPLMAWGVARLWLSFRRAALALSAGFVVITAFHLLYIALRMRDLLPQFPLLALCAGVGAADILTRLQRLNSVRLRVALTLATIVLVTGLLWARTDDMARLILYPWGYNTFGLLNPEQREAFDRLGKMTPSEAVIAVSLNSGPVGLYAKRETARPYDWTADEWLRFIEAMRHEGLPLYILVDGYEMEPPFQTAQIHYQLTPVASFPLPYFYPGAGSVNQQVNLYRVQARRLIG